MGLGLGTQYLDLEAWRMDPLGVVRSGLAVGDQSAEGIERYQLTLAGSRMASQPAVVVKAVPEIMSCQSTMSDMIFIRME